jgi:hypothetical protein
MAAESLALLPGMGFETVMNFSWEELSFWHKKAVEVYKALHGA